MSDEKGFLFNKQPKGYYKLTEYISPSAQSLYNFLLEHITKGGWTNSISDSKIQDELKWLHPVTIYKAKRELKDALMIKQQKLVIRGKEKRGIAKYYLVPDASSLSHLKKQSMEKQVKKKIAES